MLRDEGSCEIGVGAPERVTLVMDSQNRWLILETGELLPQMPATPENAEKTVNMLANLRVDETMAPIMEFMKPGARDGLQGAPDWQVPLASLVMLAGTERVGITPRVMREYMRETPTYPGLLEIMCTLVRDGEESVAVIQNPAVMQVGFMDMDMGDGPLPIMILMIESHVISARRTLLTAAGLFPVQMMQASLYTQSFVRDLGNCVHAIGASRPELLYTGQFVNQAFAETHVIPRILT